MSDFKIHFKGKYDDFECEFCKKNEETQMHMMKCEVIKKYTKQMIVPELEKNYHGNVNDQLQGTKYFLEHIKLRWKIKES